MFVTCTVKSPGGPGGPEESIVKLMTNVTCSVLLTSNSNHVSTLCVMCLTIAFKSTPYFSVVVVDGCQDVHCEGGHASTDVFHGGYIVCMRLLERFVVDEEITDSVTLAGESRSMSQKEEFCLWML